MRDITELESLLRSLDGAPWPAWKRLAGGWSLAGGRLDVRRVQGDPYAAPTVVHLALPAEVVGLAPELISSEPRRVGVAAHLARAFARWSGPTGAGGSGRSGEVAMQDPGQLVLPQAAVEVAPDGSLTARFRIGLPGRGRRIAGAAAHQLLIRHLPDRAAGSLRAAAHDPDQLLRSAQGPEDAAALRSALDAHGLVAFVADGAILPRRSGVDDRPLEPDEAVPFRSPPSLRITLDTPNAGPVTGMGLPRGVTVIAGGGYHGKSTLLRALERGVYDHRPGDGRERVVTRADGVKLRAEDGRAVTGVDIHPFIGPLPGGRDTTAFHTTDASGSTSQAAALVEALEAGSRLLLLDEDTTATNFMTRDRRMQELVPADGEPITPFVDRVRTLYEGDGVSTVIVVGGSGSWLEVADTVLVLRDYRVVDATARAAEIVRRRPSDRQSPATPASRSPRAPRVPDPASFDPRRGRRATSVKVRDGRLDFGAGSVDLRALEQLIHPGQARAIGQALLHLHRHPPAPLPELLDHIDALLADEGPAALDPHDAGESMAIRRFELAAALNRLRSLTLSAR